MTITKNNIGFTKAELGADCGAQLYAVYDYDNNFKVTTDDDADIEDGWHFDEDACREASEFFAELADELQRREAEDE